jgi:hypothetical protein
MCLVPESSDSAVRTVADRLPTDCLTPRYSTPPHVHRNRRPYMFITAALRQSLTLVSLQPKQSLFFLPAALLLRAAWCRCTAHSEQLPSASHLVTYAPANIISLERVVSLSIDAALGVLLKGPCTTVSTEEGLTGVATSGHGIGALQPPWAPCWFHAPLRPLRRHPDLMSSLALPFFSD